VSERVELQPPIHDGYAYSITLRDLEFLYISKNAVKQVSGLATRLCSKAVPLGVKSGGGPSFTSGCSQERDGWQGPPR
jgi:hypothetical protein